MKIKSNLKFIFLFMALTIAVAISLSVGAADINLWRMIKSFFANSPEQENLNYIFWQLRIPRTFACLSIGCSLGVAGALLQTMLKNPLAEPYTLGVSGGATLGAI